jgi:glycosyltransferase involved in cell wall biosynthesis
MIQQVNTNTFHEASHFIERAWFSIFLPLPEKCIHVSPIIRDLIDRMGGLRQYRLVEGLADNNIDIRIYIVCYNEEILIANTIKHYRDRFPNAIIYICDNYSTDNSTKIAINMGCQIIKWETTPENFEFKLTELKNNIWKQSEGWVIICDMDEWLCVDTAQLSKEDAKGTTCLQVIGYDIVGNSKMSTLKDIDLHSLTYGYPKPEENKNLCFNTKYITEINYDPGAHFSKPVGKITFSETPYYLKHMDWLGLEYNQNKMKIRFERTKEMQKLGMAIHYTNNMEKVKDMYSKNVEKARDISNILSV